MWHTGYPHIKNHKKINKGNNNTIPPPLMRTSRTGPPSSSTTESARFTQPQDKQPDPDAKDIPVNKKSGSGGLFSKSKLPDKREKNDTSDPTEAKEKDSVDPVEDQGQGDNDDTEKSEKEFGPSETSEEGVLVPATPPSPTREQSRTQ